MLSSILLGIVFFVISSNGFRTSRWQQKVTRRLHEILLSDRLSDRSCSVLVVTSPSPLNPDITMIQSVIDSAVELFLWNDLPKPQVRVICDGYRIVDTNRTASNGWADCKSGRISKVYYC